MLRIGVFELDLKNQELRKGGALIKLQPQPFKLLALLAARPGEIVTREELQQSIWGSDTFVDFERGLNFCIKQIRAALGDDADAPRYIETLPRRGYRFIAPVEVVRPAVPAAEAPDSSPLEPPASDPVRRPRHTALRVASVAAAALVLLAAGYLFRQYFSPQTAAGDVRLAVLPFKNLDGDASQEYFSDGLTDEMITRLGRFSPNGLRVIGRTSVMALKNSARSIREIGSTLAVSYLLEGGVRRSGSRLRITARLVQVQGESQLWAETYDRDVSDVMDIQGEVAQRIVHSLSARVLPAPQAARVQASTADFESYDAYLRGRAEWHRRTPESLQKSIEHYQRIIARNPSYALAHTGLADSYALLASIPYDVLPPHEAMPKARAAALKALALDDTLAEAHASLAQVKMFYEWDWAAAEREFRRALELNPGNATARQWHTEYLWWMGRMDEALKEIERAHEQDPLSPVIKVSVARHHFFARRPAEALAQLQEALRLDPSYFITHFNMGVANLHLGRHPEAIAEFQQATRLLPGSALCITGLGFAYAVSGRKAEARRVLADLAELARTRRYVSALYPAAIHSGLGERDQAFQWLEKAFQERADYLVYLKLEPIYDNLRPDPRFDDLLRRIGLPR